MPIYEYKCKKCGEKFELRLGFSQNRNSVKCPKCGGEEPERVFSPFLSASGTSDSGSQSSCSTGRFR